MYVYEREHLNSAFFTNFSYITQCYQLLSPSLFDRELSFRKFSTFLLVNREDFPLPYFGHFCLSVNDKQVAPEFRISFQSKTWKQSIALLAVFVILSLMKVTDIFILHFSCCSSQNIIYNYHNF